MNNKLWPYYKLMDIFLLFDYNTLTPSSTLNVYIVQPFASLLLPLFVLYLLSLMLKVGLEKDLFYKWSRKLKVYRAWSGAFFRHQKKTHPIILLIRSKLWDVFFCLFQNNPSLSNIRPGPDINRCFEHPVPARPFFGDEWYHTNRFHTRIFYPC